MAFLVFYSCGHISVELLSPLKKHSAVIVGQKLKVFGAKDASVQPSAAATDDDVDLFASAVDRPISLPPVDRPISLTLFHYFHDRCFNHRFKVTTTRFG